MNKAGRSPLGDQATPPPPDCGDPTGGPGCPAAVPTGRTGVRNQAVQLQTQDMHRRVGHQSQKEIGPAGQPPYG